MNKDDEYTRAWRSTDDSGKSSSVSGDPSAPLVDAVHRAVAAAEGKSGAAGAEPGDESTTVASAEAAAEGDPASDEPLDPVADATSADEGRDGDGGEEDEYVRAHRELDDEEAAGAARED